MSNSIQVLHLEDSMTAALSPFLFEPFLRPMPWGGQRLANWVEGDHPREGIIGEAWLLSDHPLHVSRVVQGPCRGWSLRQVMAEQADDVLGYPAARFPLLIKLLDAQDNLSVQVHPD